MKLGPRFAGMTRGGMWQGRPRIAVLLPCYNEEATIAATVAGFRAALPGAAIYVYDNNSRDRTRELAAAAGAIVRSERIRVVPTGLLIGLVGVVPTGLLVGLVGVVPGLLVTLVRVVPARLRSGLAGARVLRHVRGLLCGRDAIVWRSGARRA